MTTCLAILVHKDNPRTVLIFKWEVMGVPEVQQGSRGAMEFLTFEDRFLNDM